MEELVKTAKIFSDSNRVRIAALLVRESQLCVCEICDTLLLSQPLVSRHLKQMREAGMLSARQRGKWMLYSMNRNKESTLACWYDELSRIASNLPPLVACSAMAKKNEH